jgi:glycosyltransferase involved in cell wall biosynthesis
MPSSPESGVAVIVIGYAPPELLGRCLDVLRDQTSSRSDVELLVVAHPSHQGTPFAPVRSRFPGIGWIEAPFDQNVARLRGIGIARTRAPVVALLEGDCIPEPGWVERLTTLRPAGALGGAIEPGRFRRALDWAGFFCEFAPFMRPLPPKPAQLPGSNVVYRREALPPAERLAAHGLFETFVNASLGEESLATDDDLVVRHERTWSTRLLIATRFHHGRVFASLRVSGQPLSRRLPYIGLAAALPAVLCARVLGEVFRRRRFRLRAVLAAPWIVVLSLSWALGELAGYAAGPGSSLDQWR